MSVARGQPWTEQENAQLVRWKVLGRTHDWMAAKLGRSVPSVAGQVVKLRNQGFIPRKPKLGPRSAAERQAVPQATMKVSSAYLRALEMKAGNYDELTKEVSVLAEQIHIYMGIVEQLANDFPHVLDEVCE